MAAVPSLGRASGVEPLSRHPDEAAQQLYERHAGHVLAYCRRRLASQEEAEDALQSTFLYALRGLQRGVVPAFETAWLLKIAENVCHSRWQSARRRSVETSRDPHVLEDTIAARRADDDVLIGLPEALAELTDQQRRAILLREWQGLSYREIAEDLGVSVSAVETLIFRARRALAEQLDAQPRPRRLARAVDVGSLAAGLKSFFAGSAAVKVAAAVAVVGVAVPAGAVLRERAGGEPARTPTQRPGTLPASTPTAEPTTVARASRKALPKSAGRPADGSTRRIVPTSPAPPPAERAERLSGTEPLSHPAAPSVEPAVAVAAAPTVEPARPPATSPAETPAETPAAPVGTAAESAAAVAEPAEKAQETVTEAAAPVVETATEAVGGVVDAAETTVEAAAGTVEGAVASLPEPPTVDAPVPPAGLTTP